MLKDISFRSIGPSVMSGRVADLDVNPVDPTEFYVAYATGGLWHTVNNGQSFVPVFDSEAVLFIGDIAVNWGSKPAPAANRIIWVGTGEVNSSRSSYAGIGIYKSNNGGKTWEYKGLPETHHIGKIQLHPTDKNTIWIAALGHLYSPNKERGIFKTVDGGTTWKHTLFVDENTGAVDMDINPANPLELYASAWYRTRSAWNFEESGKSSGIYKSTDGGETWKQINTPTSGFPTGEGVGRIGIAVYPKDPSIVYAVVDNNSRKPDTVAKTAPKTGYILRDFEKLTKAEFLALEDVRLDSFLLLNRVQKRYSAATIKQLVKDDKIAPTALYEYLLDANASLFNTPIVGCEVYKSSDGGNSWVKTNTADLNIYFTYGYYFGKIYVSPSNQNKVYILGFYAQVSDDGGKTFKTMDKPNVHADHHALWVNPSRDSHLVNGNDGGVNITYDDGENWFKANTPPVGQYYAIALDNAKPYNVYGGLQDNGSWYGPSTYKQNPSWVEEGEYPYKRIGGGDGMQVQVDTRDNKTMYYGFQFGYYFRKKKDSISKSIKPQHALGERALRFNWQTPILLSGHNQDVLYFGTNRIFRSLDRGDSMIATSNDLTNGGKPGDVPYGTITSISESPLKFGLLYAGTDDGNIHVSKDGGYTWTNISKKLPPSLWVSGVVASKYQEGRVYATLNGYRYDHFLPYLFVSDDFGGTWRPIGKDLPFEPLNVVREDPLHDSVLYVGSDGGVYVSIDAGNSFMLWNKGLPASVPVHDIAIQPRDKEIVIATHGRSLYAAKLDSLHLLIKDPSFRQTKQDQVNRTLRIAKPERNELLFNREGIEVNCPPLKPKKSRNKKALVTIVE